MGMHLRLLRANASRVIAALAIVCSVQVSVAGATQAPHERWRQTAVQTFTGADAEIRSQGMATDGHDLFFSWQLGLMRTTSDPLALLAINPYAIPVDLVLDGSNHIGDIDYYDGRIYAPIEDGDRYLRPYIGLYDARTLLYTGVRYALPQSLLVEGVPWVAVDPGRRQIYTAEWNNTKVLNVHSLTDLHVIRTVTLSETAGRIQGAKMLDGLLYAAQDNGNLKSILAIDPDTGTVYHVFDRKLPPGTEAEGLSFTKTAAGTVMHTLEVDPNGLSVHYRAFLREPMPAPPPVLVVQTSRTAGRHWKTVTTPRRAGSRSYAVRVRLAGRTLASGRTSARRLRLIAVPGVTPARRTAIRRAVRRLLTDLVSVTVATSKR
jgi:hypothetical protein